MDKKTMKKELQLIRSTINSVTGLEDEDEALLQYAYEAVDNLIKSLADQPANQLDDINVADIPAQQQEPLAYAVFHRNGGGKSLHWPEQHSEDGDHSKYQLVPLYTSTPASKPWVGLTDEDIGAVCGFGEHTTASTRFTLMTISRAIEAKLKEKNCG